MIELYENIRAKMLQLATDMRLNAEDGNKAAGARARKNTLELEKLFKQYRKESVAASK